MTINVKSDGSARLGRPPGPTPNRGPRPWDETNEEVLKYVAANPDLERWKIASYLAMTQARLSTITCSPNSVERLKQLALRAGELTAFRLPLIR